MLSEPLFYLPAALVLGLLVGSFLNVVIYRLPIMIENYWQTEARTILNQEQPKAPTFNLCVPASACPHCHERIRPWQNVPILSYLFLRGRCHYCHAPISPRYPFVEALTGACFFTVAWVWGATPVTLAGLVLTAALIALTFIDADTQILPDEITLPLVWSGLLFNLFFSFVPLKSAVLGAATGYLILWIFYQGFKLLTGKEGMGFGDFKLLAALGAWLGVAAVPVIIITSCITGIAAAVVMQTARKDAAIPFGPALASAGWVVFVAYAPVMQLVNWWLRLSGFTS